VQIHYLAARNDIEGVKRQLAAGVSVDAQYAVSGETPLMFAAKDRRARVNALEFLISHGANPNATSYDSNTPLGLAAQSGSSEKVR
jgi:ankyrin repeat protein